jgi:hypothetical protein
MKMWNYNTGECLITFPNPDQMEVSLIWKAIWHGQAALLQLVWALGSSAQNDVGQ